MSKSFVKKSLKKLKKDELIDILMGVYDFNEQSKSYLENLFTPQPDKEMEKCKEIIDYEFDPWESHRMNFERCRKCVSEFEKMNAPVQMVADLKLYLAEAEIHICEYGDYYDDTYNKILDDFKSALDYISANELSWEFEERIWNCLKMKVHGYYFKKDLETVAQDTCSELFYDEDDEELDGENIKKRPFVDDYDDSDMAFDEGDDKDKC